MLTPRFFTESLFDDWFDEFPFRDMENVNRRLYGKHAGREMLTDVRDHEDHYEVEMDLPGFKKDEIKLELNSGYLTVTASKGLDKDEKDKNGKYIRKERYTGHCSRSFYVGEDLKQEDIKAKFENGLLLLEFPKEVKKPELPEKQLISIA